ncbi:hypothetical protein DL93DRAFT_2087097 [Clavulina sp. PMI_390]|nr:hypothetical protein DL93DRAFT_2087097 [Clavulina sp. PMI_390]
MYHASSPSTCRVAPSNCPISTVLLFVAAVARFTLSTSCLYLQSFSPFSSNIVSIST